MSVLTLTLNVGGTSKEQPVKNEVQYMMVEPGGH